MQAVEPLAHIARLQRHENLETAGKTQNATAGHRNNALATLRYPVLEATATVGSFENGRVFSLRILRAGELRTKQRSG